MNANQLPLQPATIAALDKLSAPARTWAMAKAAFEIAHEQNFAEQNETTRQATLDDPEPAESWRSDDWKPWYDRNGKRIDAATKPIAARYPHDLEKLYKLAEQNMVDWFEERMRTHKPADFERTGLALVFKKYRDNELYGDMRERFLKLAFNCPIK
jgi:hypothetical protein